MNSLPRAELQASPSGFGAVRISGVGTAVPPYRWPQSQTHAFLAEHSPFYQNHRIEKMFLQSGIESRYFSRSPEAYDVNATVGALHELFQAEAPPLALKAARRALTEAETSPGELSLVAVATCTGYLCPGLTAHLIRDLNLSPSIQRADIVGMGCAGAVPALQRGFDHVRAHRQGKALVVAVEVCSACLFLDQTIETVVGNIICGDGAAAVVLEGGEDSSGPEILGFKSVVNTEWMGAVGFQNVEGKLRIILSKELRQAAGPAVAEVVEKLLEKFGVQQSEISHWVFHAGGAAVLANIDECMGFHGEELACSREVFREHGNMSSPTTLFVLQEIQRSKRPVAGDLGVALALGPGLATEAALLRW